MSRRAHNSVAPDGKHSIRTVVLASFIGTTIEWYDFFIYGTAAALIFNRLFFPNVDPFLGTLASFATFAVGFVARPLGGLIFGHFGDRVGRKSMLIYSLLIMGVATFVIGILPTYETAGVWAPVLLVAMRIAQGIGIGGEWAGAVLLAVEHSRKGSRGFSGSWPQMGGPAGMLLSTLVFALLTSVLTEQELMAWGWRLPFLLSVALIAVGLFIRVKILETPVFERMKQRGVEAAPPIVTVVRTHRRVTLLAMGMRLAENSLFYIITVFVLSYGEARLSVSRSTMLMAVSLAAFCGLFSIPFFGALSDKIGRRPVYMFGALFSLVFAYPFFLLLDTQSFPLICLALVLAMNLGHDAMYGPQAAYLSELFGTSVRYSGASLSYQLSSVLAGGFAPLIAFSLLTNWGPGAVALYVGSMCAISALATYLAPETYRGDLADELSHAPQPATATAETGSQTIRSASKVAGAVALCSIVATGEASSLAGREAGQPPSPVSFHHLHLNSVDPEAAIAFYTQQFPSTSRTTYAGAPALSAGDVRVLFTRVTSPPPLAPQSAFWHFGWHVVDSRKNLNDYQKRTKPTLLPLYRSAAGETVWINTDSWPGALTAAGVADARSRNLAAQGGGGWAYMRGPDGVIVEYHGDFPRERLNHVHMYQDDPYCADRWYQRHLGASLSPAPAVPGNSVEIKRPADDANCTVRRGEPSWPSLTRSGTIRAPAGGVMFGGVALNWYPRQESGRLESSIGQAMDHVALSVNNLDEWIRRLTTSGVRILRSPYSLGDTRAALIEGPSREGIELVESRTTLASPVDSR
jgi:metabolite-proton symporter